MNNYTMLKKVFPFQDGISSLTRDDQTHNAIYYLACDNIQLEGLEEKFQNYMEDDLGETKIHFGKICAKQKHVDKWWKLKGKGTFIFILI